MGAGSALVEVPRQAEESAAEGDADGAHSEELRGGPDVTWLCSFQSGATTTAPAVRDHGVEESLPGERGPAAEPFRPPGRCSLAVEGLCAGADTR